MIAKHCPKCDADITDGDKQFASLERILKKYEEDR